MVDDFAKKTTLMLVRHCQATGNKDRTFQGRTDCDITEMGGEQLDLLAEKMRAVPLDAIYSSPLKRARLTAEAVGRFHDLPMKIEPRLAEIDAGKWEKMSWVDIERTFPHEFELWCERPDEFVAPSGESMREVYDRALEAVRSIVEQNAGKAVAVVSHGCTIRAIASWAYGGIEKMSEVTFCDNTGVCTLEVGADMQPNMLKFNDVSHLREDMIRHGKWSTK